MRLVKWITLPAMLLVCAALLIDSPAARADVSASDMSKPTNHFYFLTPGSIDFKTLLTPPPANNSFVTHAEINWMLELQNTRTAEQIARAKREVNLNPFLFSNVLGSWFNPDDLPITTQLLRQASNDTSIISYTAKNFFARPRPYTLDPRLKPCVKLESSFSYPSGHSSHAIVWGIILSTMFPERRDAIMARAYQIGDDRVIGGVHFPSDVAAGHVLGYAIAAALLANPEFQADMEKAKQECLADPKFSELNH
ncbi:MAG TPA: phosphatase PAP2 family protein [Phycisphaerae bacterium]|nr:phosphatase PAP2 family protein [Phycisphaerae bacterium]